MTRDETADHFYYMSQSFDSSPSLEYMAELYGTGAIWAELAGHTKTATWYRERFRHYMHKVLA